MGIPLTPPTITHLSTYTLQYAAQTVILPAPSLGEVQTFQSTRVFRNTRGLTRRSFIDSSWYKLNVFDLVFTNVSEAVKENLVTLAQTALGDVVSVTTHYNESKTMFIVTVDPYIEVHDDDCSFTISLTLQEVI